MTAAPPKSAPAKATLRSKAPDRRPSLEHKARDTVARGFAAPGLLGAAPASRHRKAAGAGPALATDLIPAGSPLTLAPSLRAAYERRLGVRLDGVRLHRGAAAAEAARDAGAKAYAVGDDVVFGESRFDPASSIGQELLLHELAHVAQSRTGRAQGDLLRDEHARPGGIGNAAPEGPFEVGEGLGREDEHVLFERDSADLDSSDTATLRHLAEGHPEPCTVDVYGYASREGTTEYNRNLSAHRAMAVKRALEALLPPGSAVRAHAQGETDGFGRLRENRRVGIAFEPVVSLAAGWLTGRRRPRLFDQDLQLRLDPSLFPGGALPGATPGLPPPGVTPPATAPSPDVTPTPAAPTAQPGSVGPSPWTFPTPPPFTSSLFPTTLPISPFLSPQQPVRPTGIRPTDIDYSAMARSATSRGVRLGGDFGQNVEEYFISQTDALVRLGLPPSLAGWWAQSTLDSATEYRLRFENPTQWDITQIQQEQAGTQPHTLSIDLLKVPGYLDWLGHH